jgi:NADH-quinone oxidoreductase subunit A
MPGLVGYLLLFLVVGVGFILVHLLVGKVIRPAKPDPEKLTIYECGEPTIGSAWVQFDLRFYVVALLFVIFDVEVAFFFPWAVVFGKANALANPRLPEAQRVQLTQELTPAHAEAGGPAVTPPPIQAEAAHQLAWIAFWDIVVFFGVLLVGFAYLWKRGDLDWVRSTAAERAASRGLEPTRPLAEPEVLVGAASDRM